MSDRNGLGLCGCGVWGREVASEVLAVGQGIESLKATTGSQIFPVMESTGVGVGVESGTGIV